MSELILENVSVRINNLIDKCMKCEICVEEAQKETTNIMDVIVTEYNKIINDEYMNDIHITISKIIFSKDFEMIVKELYKINEIIRKIVTEFTDINQNIDWYDEVKRRIVQKDMFMSELMVSKDLEYEKRMNIFKEYIKNDIKIKDGNAHKEIVDTIRRLIIILFIPIHTKTSRVGKNDIKILFKCNHSGKSKETCKGRSCNYEVVILINYNGMNEIIETGEHNHSLDYSFITSKTCPLLKSEKEMIPKRKEDIIEFIAHHPHVIIPLKKYRQIQNSMDKRQIIENVFLTNLYYENDSFIKITNTFRNGYIHSITFIHKRVSQMEYCKRRWYMDDTSNTNVYNKNMIAIIDKDDNSFNQLLSFGYLYDQTEESFKLFLNQLYTILGYKPDIIICDRCGAQFNAIKEIYPQTKVFFCRVHIERSLKKYFKKDHVIMKMFYLMIKMKLSEYDMIETWKEIIRKNIRNAREEQASNEIEMEETEETEDINEQGNLYETDRADTLILRKEEKQTGEEIKILLENAKNLNIKKGILCLMDLVEHKDNWMPSECIKYGIYQDYTTNRVEGFFGHLKRLTKIIVCYFIC